MYEQTTTNKFDHDGIDKMHKKYDNKASRRALPCAKFQSRAKHLAKSF